MTPEFDVHVSVGAEDQPVIVVEVKVALDEAFAATDWPSDEIADIKQRVREAVRGSDADQFDWFVSLRRAGFVAAGAGQQRREHAMHQTPGRGVRE